MWRVIAASSESGATFPSSASLAPESRSFCDIVDNIGALIIRIGFWGYYTIVIIRSHQKSIGNYLGPYI